MWLLLVGSLIASPCAEAPGSVVVDSSGHRLHLCGRDGQEAARYPVRLGRGGLGKRREGDARTPLGRYRLGRPRPSSAGFDTFIPVGYPTSAQRSKGFTGGAVGIHGPPSGLGISLVSRLVGDWTLGCIALDSVAAVRAVAAWVRAHRIRHIVILGDP